MPLVDSLLTAVVRSDGDALVLHVGEKPYVVAAAGPVELSRQGLGLGAMEGMLAQLLTADALRSLREMGAVEHELDDRPASAGDRFTVVAARGGDDIWIELRRHRRMAPPVAAAPAFVPDPVAVPAAAAEVVTVPAPLSAPEPMAPAHAVEAVAHAADTVAAVAPVIAPAVSHDTAEVDDAAVVDLPAVEMPAPLPAETPEPVIAVAPPETPDVVVAVADATVSHADMAAANLFAAEMDAPTDDILAFDTPVFAADDVYELVAGAAADAIADLDATLSAAPVEPAEAADPVTPAVPAVVAVPPVAQAVPLPAPVAAADPGAVAAPAVAVDPVVPAMASVPVVEPIVAVVESAPVVPAARVEPVPAVAVVEPVPAAAVAPAPAAAPAAAAAPAPVAPPTPLAVPVATAPPAYDNIPPPVRFDPPQMPAAWSTPASPRFDSHPHESSRYGLPEPQPVLPGLASELEAIGRESAATDSLPAVVLSLTRDGARGSGGGVRGNVRTGGIERLLRLAAARGASALYLTTQARPAVRVDGDIRLLDGEAALSSGDVEAAVLELAPEGARDKESAEWIRDLADVGRVRITTFRDYRGPGALLRMIQARATSAEQLGLVREIQALATEPEGLVIVTGPRASGKSTLVSAFVDLINRQRNDYVITLEGQIRLVHESRGSLISQRELRGSAAEVVTAARAALRENPDVLVIEDLRSPDVLQVALDAAGSGLLVFASVTAASATAALERLVDLCPSDERRNVRAALAEHLRGVVAQVLLRKAGGGRLAARELVLNTNAVAALVSDGQIAQLPRAIDSGRKLGMAPLNDALVAFVQSGAVDVREAYRKADDKAGLLALLRREGIDTSFVERLA